MIARTLEPKLAEETSSAFHNHLGRSLGIDMAAWRPTAAANVFNRVRKNVVLDCLAEIGGTDLRSRYATAKKGDLANAAEKICAGTAIIEAEVRAKALAWVPSVMSFEKTVTAHAAGNAEENCSNMASQDAPASSSEAVSCEIGIAA